MAWVFVVVLAKQVTDASSQPMVDAADADLVVMENEGIARVIGMAWVLVVVLAELVADASSLPMTNAADVKLVLMENEGKAGVIGLDGEFGVSRLLPESKKLLMSMSLLLTAILIMKLW